VPEADQTPVPAPTTTTLSGVSIFSRQRQRKADVFDIALSPEGIAIQRAGRTDQQMAWERIAQWEIEERPGFLLLNLRGGGSVTPLVVKGWSLEDLETVMREVTAGSAEADAGVAAAAPVTPDPLPVIPVEEPTAPARGSTPAPVPAPSATPPPEAPVPSRAARRQAAQRPRRSPWEVVVTVVLLGVLATAVTLVLLQSAGVIDWSFLGPVA
jgi:hypothetical protein